MKKQFIGILLFFAIIFPITCLAQDNKNIPDVPTSNIYFQDYSKVTKDETKTAIINASKKLDEETSAQVVVVIIDSLKDMPIKEYSLALFRKWGIGNKEKNNGVLILIVTSTKQVRIEVGYGMEGRLNDAKCGEIIRDKMIPYLNQYELNNSIISGYNAVVHEVYSEYSINLEESSVIPINNKKINAGIGGLSLLGKVGVFLAFIFIVILTIHILRKSDYAVIYDNCKENNNGNFDTSFTSSGSDSGGFGGGDTGGGGADC